MLQPDARFFCEKILRIAVVSLHQSSAGQVQRKPYNLLVLKMAAVFQVYPAWNAAVFRLMSS
ncbi:hypothetical protein GCM43_07540 [Janthinobacterium aquaticum]|nr:hypothetical protein GCM43_07540 [Janthinobacterium sp. FT58W]